MMGRAPAPGMNAYGGDGAFSKQERGRAVCARQVSTDML